MKHRERVFVVLVIGALFLLAIYTSWRIERNKQQTKLREYNKQYTLDSIAHEKRMDSLDRVADSTFTEFKKVVLDLQSKASKYDSIKALEDAN